MKHRPIHLWFRDVARGCPERTAIDTAHRQWSYQELEEWSNRLAFQLLASGTTKGSTIGVLAEDRPTVIAALLATFKAGGVFVALDPRLPDPRLAAMLRQVSPRWLLVEPPFFDLLERLPADAYSTAEVLALDGDLPAPGGDQPTSSLAHPGQGTPDLENTDLENTVAWAADDPCYVVFTSGSTGQPKGITGRLKAIDHFIRWEIETFGLGAGVRGSQLTTPAFDAFLRDVFVPLCSGGTVCVPPEPETVLDAGRLVRWIDERQIQLLHLVPSVFRTLLDEVDRVHRPDLFASLRHVLLAGEALFPADVRRFVKHFGDRIRLVNLYGASETTMTKLFYRIEPADAERSVIPIGKPMAGAKAVILDDNGRICPRKTVGEIYIRTPYRSLGYFNRPDLTAQVFIDNPLRPSSQEPVPGDVVYKTGDLGRLADDGNFEFVGRKDQQIKLRGIRVEMGEVEGALREHPAVRDVAVVDRDDAQGDKFLCAYVELKEQASAETSSATFLEDLRAFLARSLPAYLIPSSLTVLNQLPRTTTQKVDRRALPQPTAVRPEGPYVAPRTPTEELVAGIWQQVLGVERVGAEDDFFALGGHSLRATRILSRVRRDLGVEIPLVTLFDAPTVRRLSAAIGEAQRLRRGLSGLSPVEPLCAATRRGRLRLSFAQERLWFLDQLAPGLPVYNIASQHRLSGPLDVAALARALDQLNARHETLRTRFEAADGRPFQIIDDPGGQALPVVDLSALAAPQRRAARRRLAFAESQRPFVLSQDPLLRTTLVRSHAAEHVLLLTIHHTVSDGWSMGVLLGELTALYRAFCDGRPAALPAFKVQYADFAHWQRQWLTSEVLNTQLSYWRDRLAGLAVLELATDRPRPAFQTHRGARHPFQISPAVSAALAELAQERGATLFMTLLAAFTVLLQRHSGQDETTVGTPIANRDQPELEGLIGLFVNLLVLRVQAPRSISVSDLIAKVREVALEAYAHPDLPFEKLVEELKLPWDPSRQPLFQVMFVYHNVPTATKNRRKLPGLNFSQAQGELTTATFDLTLAMTESDNGLLAYLDYNTDLFDPSSIGRMAGHLRSLLAAVAAAPEESISRLPLLSAPERHQLQHEWASSSRSTSSPTTLHHLCAAQAKRTPQAVAVAFSDQQLTFGELALRADRLAHHLRYCGIGPDTVVALDAERCPEMVVGMLGILAAGGAFLPLDRQLPEERQAWMLKDAGAQKVLTAEQVRTASACLPQGVLGVQGTATADNLAYVIYTSGSTGIPKGVMVPHRAICQTLAWRRQSFALSPRERFLQNIPATFDPSVWQIFGALTTGGTAVLAPPGAHSDLRCLENLLTTQRITITDFPPSLLRLLLAENHLAPRMALRLLFVGGEPMPVELREEFLAHLKIDLRNIYGPTEAAIDATCQRCRSAPEERRVPIGRPAAGKEIYLLDAALRLVPQGVPGELFIGGGEAPAGGLARGYLGQVGKTAERFLPNPSSRRRGARLYKTGDLCRHRGDGALEFLGRTDRQVKLRGQRIELGEIEAALSAHEKVREAIVVLRREAPGREFLVGYVTSPPEDAPSPLELSESLQQKLPSSMIPSVFVTLNALPTTPHGKVDHAALPAPDAPTAGRNGLGGEGPPVAPRDGLETTLAAIWQEVLNLENVSVHDNFFDLGGHSLLAMQAMSRAGAALRLELSPRLLFEAPTVAGLAVALKRLGQLGDTTELEGIPPRQGDSDHFPLSFAQQRLWFLSRLQPRNPAYNISEGHRFRGPFHPAALAAALQEIIWRHEILRTRFDWVAEEPVQIITPHQDLLLPHIDLAGLPRPHREGCLLRLTAELAARPFDLIAAPPVRFQLVRLAEQDHALLFALHHIVSDGWSMGIFFRELQQGYEAFSSADSGPRRGLPTLRIQYADFAVWQRSWLSGEVLERQLTYWRQQLHGAQKALALPTDHPRPALRTSRGANRPFSLRPEPSAKLKALGEQVGATPFMTLLAVFGILLHRSTGQADLLVGTPIANRGRPEIEGLIGVFLNTLVLRLDLTGDPTFKTLLARVRQMMVEAHDHADLPFEKLVEELDPERDMGRTPLFQVLFTLLKAPAGVGRLHRLKTHRVRIPGRSAKFDLSLSMMDSASGLSGSLEYDRELFAPSTIARMARQFDKLVRDLAQHPEEPLSARTLLSRAERHHLLAEWNDTQADVAHTDLHRLFAAQMQKTPDAVAVVFEQTTLSFRELNQQAHRLAATLGRLGAGPGLLVGVCLERGLDLLIALLAVLKAGAAYVPLDPDLPTDRLAFILAEIAAPVLVTRPELVAQLPEQGAQIVFPNSAPDLETAAAQDEDFPRPAAANHLAYAIYTSGSTGQPKGVQITHRGVVNFLATMRRTLGLTYRDVMMAVTTVSFDIAVLELFLPLTTGGCLVMASRQTARDGHRLARLLTTSRARAMQATPALWQLLLETGWGGAPGLKILCGGEALPAALAQQLVARGASLTNLYGPTETTIWSSVEAVNAVPTGTTVPVGRPLANTQFYVVDRVLEPVPIGVVGELAIGGMGLTRGYLYRPGLSAEKLVPDPFLGTLGGRLYRTGDLVRALADGRLEFLGRTDHQVKVRGFRIELGEIEAVLESVPGVRRAVVAAREEVSRGLHLVAYVVPAGESLPEPAALRHRLRQKLPEYMVPAHFVHLEALPLSPSGKLDRRALPAPGRERPKAGAVGGEPNLGAPRNILEHRLTELWEELLRVQPIGVTERFFDLGGHSLLAVRLQTRIEERFGRDLPLATLFRAATIEEQAKVLRQEPSATAQTPLVTLQSTGSRRPFFCMHPAGGHVHCYLPMARHLGWDQPFYGLQDPNTYEPGPPRFSLEDMAARYAETILSLEHRGPYLLGGWSLGGLLAFEVARALHERGHSIALLALFDTISPAAKRRSATDEETADRQLLVWLAENLLDLSITPDDLLGRPEDECLAYILEQATASGRVTSAADRRRAHRLFELYRTEIQAGRRYAPTSPSPHRIQLFRSAETLAETPDDPTLGWNELTTAGVDLHVTPGNHYRMVQEPHVHELARSLRACLDQAASEDARKGDR